VEEFIFLFFLALVISLNIVVYSYNLARHFKTAKSFLLVSIILVILSWLFDELLALYVKTYHILSIANFLFFIPQTCLFLGIVAIVDIKNGLLTSNSHSLLIIHVILVMISTLFSFIYIVYKDTRITHVPKSTSGKTEPPSATLKSREEDELGNFLI